MPRKSKKPTSPNFALGLGGQFVTVLNVVAATFWAAVAIGDQPYNFTDFGQGLLNGATFVSLLPLLFTFLLAMADVAFLAVHLNAKKAKGSAPDLFFLFGITVGLLTAVLVLWSLILGLAQ